MFLSNPARCVLKRIPHHAGGTTCHSWKRCLNNSQTATALRPFYFIVHPDLFGRYPRERSVNEESLKLLHEYVAAIQTQPAWALTPVELNFYMRPVKQVQELKDVQIKLKSPDLRQTVTTILQACGLPLDYVNTVPDQVKSTGSNRPIHWHASYYTASGIPNPEAANYRPPPRRTLSSWLQSNSVRVQEYSESRREAQTEIDRLCADIVSMTGVADIRWENVWGNRHFIASLRSFYKLCENQLERMKKTIAGRILVFGNVTGVNLHGDIVLGSDDVITEWISLLHSIRAYDPVLERLPRMEEELSTLLNQIRVIRRHKHEVVMAQMYELLLNKMLNSLRRSQDLVLREFGENDLSHLDLVVESESGPLALSNCGQLLVPASLPGSLMVQFISENKDRAATFLLDAKLHEFYMNQVLDQCAEKLDISTITRDDAITPQQMTECCQRLLDNRYDINEYLQGTKLKVSTYYTVMRDGEITIPWNWAADET